MSLRTKSIWQRPAGRIFHPLSLERQIDLQRLSKPRSSFLLSTRPSKYLLWDSDRLEKALSDIDEGMSLRQASMEWDIPKSTLNDYCTHQKYGITQEDSRRYFTDFEESTLADFIVHCGRLNRQLKRLELFLPCDVFRSRTPAVGVPNVPGVLTFL